MTLNDLIKSFRQTNALLKLHVIKAINVNLTIRNWLFGYFIVEFEQKGSDRAKYGEFLLKKLSERLAKYDISNTHERELRRYRLFYQRYPQIGQAVLSRLDTTEIRETLSPKFEEDQIRGTLSPALTEQNKSVLPEKLLTHLSWSHFVPLMDIEDYRKRLFYELECIKGTWSVRELQRQISTLYYERSGMSRKPGLLSEQVQQSAEQFSIREIIKSPFTFEFLGLKAKDVVYESDLEQALIENLQEFMLELGHGICFEARQKRIVIGDEYFFIDLVFYHRILKCHILIELKTKEVKHEHIGQLNVYLNYFKKEIMRPDDNPPVGILLVTEKNKALVEYATAGMDEKLFVSKYLVELPSKKQLEEFLMRELQKN